MKGRLAKCCRPREGKARNSEEERTHPVLREKMNGSAHQIRQGRGRRGKTATNHDEHTQADSVKGVLARLGGVSLSSERLHPPNSLRLVNLLPFVIQLDSLGMLVVVLEAASGRLDVGTVRGGGRHVE